MEFTRLVTPEFSMKDETVEKSLRPRTFDEYIGQEKTVRQLKVFIEAAKMRGEPLDHVLLYGPPGLGKTTLSHIIANEMGVSVKITSGPAIERPGDLAAILTNLKPNDILFIDEIHRLNRTVEEILYPAMEDQAIDIVVGKGPAARSVRLDLPEFTLVGATTRAGNLSSPLRDRFGVMLKLSLYGQDALVEIVKRSAQILEVSVDPKAAEEIALRSRGTPRIVNRLLKRVRDYAQVFGEGDISFSHAQKALEMLEIDALGLDQVDLKLLTTIIENYDGGPVGLDALSASSGEEKTTIEDVYEPYLLQIGFINRTPRGRMVSPKAYRHLGRSIEGKTLLDEWE